MQKSRPVDLWSIGRLSCRSVSGGERPSWSAAFLGITNRFYFVRKGKVKVKAICVCLILLQHVRRSPFSKFSVTYHTRYGGVNCHFCQKSSCFLRIVSKASQWHCYRDRCRARRRRSGRVRRCRVQWADRKGSEFYLSLCLQAGFRIVGRKRLYGVGGECQIKF